MKWDNGRLVIAPPKKPKKITGTRLASILGLDKWNSDFKTWCAITRVYEEPFEGNKYTEAGKILEPKIIEYLKTNVFFDKTAVKTPEDVYGADPFKKTWGDFFKNIDVFGGMWDAIHVKNGQEFAVIEIKTTKRAEDWIQEVPTNYLYQGMMYAHLLGLEDVIMVAVILEDDDYENLEDFKVNSKNIIIRKEKVTDRFKKDFDKARIWWTEHVVSGISPVANRTVDKAILHAIGVAELPVGDITLLEEAESLLAELAAVADKYKAKEAKLKKLTEQIKSELQEKLVATSDTKLTVAGKYEWVLSRGVTTSINKDKLKEDGLLEKYQETKETFTLRKSRIK